MTTYTHREIAQLMRDREYEGRGFIDFQQDTVDWDGIVDAIAALLNERKNPCPQPARTAHDWPVRDRRVYLVVDPRDMGAVRGFADRDRAYELARDTDQWVTVLPTFSDTNPRRGVSVSGYDQPGSCRCYLSEGEPR